jgi:hypothetical protein
MVFNATFNNISVILWRSFVLVEETDNTEKTTDLSQVTDKFYHHNVISSTYRRERGSSAHLWWYNALITHIVVKPTAIRSRPRQPFYC